MFLRIGFCCLLLLIAGCEPRVTFNEPQPPGVNSLSAFPDRVQGAYLSADGYTALSITNDQVLKKVDLNLAIPKDSLGSDFTLQGDSVLISGTGNRVAARLAGDSVFFHYSWQDTLFDLSDGNILKKWKGYYFLNIKYQGGGWSVLRLRCNRGLVTISEIGGQDDINSLKEVADQLTDSPSHQFSVTKRQFRHFIKQRSDANTDSFFIVK